MRAEGGQGLMQAIPERRSLARKLSGLSQNLVNGGRAVLRISRKIFGDHRFFGKYAESNGASSGRLAHDVPNFARQRMHLRQLGFGAGLNQHQDTIIEVLFGADNWKKRPSRFCFKVLGMKAVNAFRCFGIEGIDHDVSRAVLGNSGGNGKDKQREQDGEFHRDNPPIKK
jgi:hypothetical protein